MNKQRPVLKALINKEETWEVIGRFEGEWEVVFTASSEQEARSILNDYRINDPGRVYAAGRVR